MQTIFGHGQWRRAVEFGSLFVLGGSQPVCMASQPRQPGALPMSFYLRTARDSAGQFVKSSGSSLTFKSDALGEITVDWSKVKELQSSAKVAVIPKGVRSVNGETQPPSRRARCRSEDQQIHLTGVQLRTDSRS